RSPPSPARASPGRATGGPSSPRAPSWPWASPSPRSRTGGGTVSGASGSVNARRRRSHPKRPRPRPPSRRTRPRSGRRSAAALLELDLHALVLLPRLGVVAEEFDRHRRVARELLDLAHRSRLLRDRAVVGVLPGQRPAVGRELADALHDP